MLKRVQLRWHPDKFMQKFSAVLATLDDKVRQEVFDAVNMVCRAINTYRDQAKERDKQQSSAQGPSS